MTKLTQIESAESVVQRSLKAYTAQEVQALQQDPKVFVLDCRAPGDYIRSHVPGALFVPLEANFAIWTAFFVDPRKGEKIILVTEPGKEEQAITRLTRTGLDCVIGYLQGGHAAWQQAGLPTAATDILHYTTAEDWERESRAARVVDVRNLDEWNNEGVLPRAEL